MAAKKKIAAKKDKVPVPLLGAWLRESYLAVAPKKIGALLREGKA
jgi:hypothetical protein